MKAVTRFLIRAPLLPLAGGPPLGATPLGRMALELASPSLATATGARAARAEDRYTRRARFRPTPSGLLAGVGVGRLGPRTTVDTGAPAPRLDVTWERMAALARALLDDPETRDATRLRVAPSLLEHEDHVVWLAPGGRMFEVVLDELLAAVLAAARRFTPWRTVAAAAGDDDDVLLGLVDDGLLVSDLTPPLVGPLPLAALERRLARRGSAAARAARVALRALTTVSDPATARAALAGLPGASDAEPLVATLLFPEAEVVLAGSAVTRAAALAPLLVRLAEALAPPTAERDLHPAVAAEAAAELLGPGTFDLAALALGGYGVRADEPAPRPPATPPAALLTLLVDRITAAAAAGAAEIVLDPDELDRLLPPARVPATLELFLVPRREGPGEAPGTGWLLGLHGPAGATWGRFAHALGAPLREALDELADAEPPGRLDVAWTPEPSFADLCAHPPVRAATLALITWPDGPAITPADLGLRAPAPLALDGGTPSPLWRIRSTLAPPGIFQLLTGWSLQRQHAPWALAWGALAGQAWLPRVRLGGFVVAPQSWRLPGTPPLPVQVGHEDELLLVDDAAELARLAAAPDPPRAWEIWPPLAEATVDVRGRRLEAVVAVVADDDDEEPAEPMPARVPPPSPEPGWRTFKLYGPPDRQDRVLLDAVLPAVAAAREAREIDGWFFLRYVEGARHHLRVRVRGRARGFGDRLARALVPGDVATIEETPYHREHARYGRLDVERAFEAGSDLAGALLGRDEDPTEQAVLACDVVARAAGLSLGERHGLARALRAGHAPLPDEAAPAFRARAARLHAVLTAPLDADYRALPRHKALRAVIPDLVHLLCNRLLGVEAEREAFVIYLWERTLEGQLARRR